MVPVNLRRYFNCETKGNCSDGIMIPVFKEDESLDIKERCRKWKKYMQDQMEENNFSRIMGSKAGIVDDIEETGNSITDEVNKRTKLPNEETEFRPVSYGLTYPGNLTLPSGLDKLIEDFSLDGYGRGNSVVIFTYKDRMYLQALCRSDKTDYGMIVADAFKNAGLNVSIEDKKRIKPNKMLVEKLTRI